MDPIEVKIVLPDAHQQGIRFCGCNSNAADIDWCGGIEPSDTICPTATFSVLQSSGQEK